MNANLLVQDLLRDLFLDQGGLLRWAWEELGLSLRRAASRRALVARLADRIVRLGLVDEELFWGLVTRFPTRANRIRRARVELMARPELPADEPLLHDAPLDDAEAPTVDEDLVSVDDGLSCSGGLELPEIELDDLTTEEVFPPKPSPRGAVVARVVEPARGLPDLTGLMQPIFVPC